MAIATWKDLCIDADDPSVLGRFWGEVLGLRPEVLDNGNVALGGDRPQDTIWINAVPEPKTVKHRVHLDLNVASLAPLVAAGARILAPAEETGHRWTVMADPEGGEFCAFVRNDAPANPPAERFELVVDCADSDASRRLATWWAEALGGRCVDDGRGFWWVADVAGLPFETIDMIPVPEAKQVKNRIHWDVTCDDIVGLVDRGAAVLAEPSPSTPWHVLTDPQGNEFCAFPST